MDAVSLMFSGASFISFAIVFTNDSVLVSGLAWLCGAYFAHEACESAGVFAALKRFNNTKIDGPNHLWQRYRKQMKERRERARKEQESQEFHAELEKHYPIKNTNDCSIWDYRDSHESTQLECLVPGCGWRKKVLPDDDEEAEHAHRLRHYYQTRADARDGRATWLMHSKFR